MNDLSIILPCGFSLKYKDFIYMSKTFQCPVCKKHEITRQECLNMERNKMVINENNFNLKKNEYEKLMKQLKNDPKHYIDESFDRLKREVDLRREEVKLMLNKKIDEYYNGLMEKIDAEKYLKLKDLEGRIQQTETLDLDKFDADKNLETYSKLDFFEKNKIEIENNISLVQNIIDDFKEPKFRLTDSCDEIDVKKMFGEFYLRENTKIILNNQEIDDDSRTEATIQFTINNFSLLKDRKSFILYSKKCIVRNFEWCIQIRLNEEDTWMGLFLYCNANEESNEFSVNVTAELTLLNKSDFIEDLIIENTYCNNKRTGRGDRKFVKIRTIMNPKIGYYDANEDSITVKAVLNVELPEKKDKN